MRPNSKMRASLLAIHVVLAVLLGGTLLGARHLSAQLPVVSATKVLTDLNGTYVRRKSVIANEDNARAAAIAAGVAGVDRAMQRRWRAILEMSTLPEPQIRVSNTATEVSIATGDDAPVRSPATGVLRTTTDDFDIRQKVEGTEVVQRFSTDSLAGIGALTAPLETARRHKLSADGAVLVVQTVIAGGVLANPINFYTTYDRVPPEARQR